MFVVSSAKIHLFLPTILYILTIHLYFLPFAHFLLFTLHFLFLFVLQSKDFIVFLQKNQTTYQMKRNKKTFYTLLYIAGIISIWLLPLQAFGSIKLDGKRLSAKDGLSCNTVNDIIQDRDGFIWLGTPNGMSRYDGYQFINFTYLSKNSGQKSHHSISQLINDEKHGLIWGYNPSNILCCFDLETAHFSDYFDKENATLLKNRFKSQNGMWLFSEDFGARYLTYSNGKFQATDYTTKNGKLIGDHQLQMTEDAKQNVWIASDKGLNRITPDGKSHLKLKNQHIITLTTDGNHIAVLTDKGDAFLYDNSGKLVRKSHLPSMVGYVGKSRASFFWQGEWYIFTQEETFAMNLKTGIFHKPAIQIPNAMSKFFLKSYEFLYDKKGNAYLFSKNGKLYKKFHLLDDKAYINSRDKNFVAAEDANGNVYIVSYGNGLFIYNRKEDELQHFSTADKNSLFHSNFLLSVFIDRSGCIWICTGEGVYCCRELKDLNTEHVKIEPNTNREWSNYVRHISNIGNDKLAVTTRANITYIYDAKTQQRTLEMQTDACVYDYAIDPQGKKWIATKGDGIYIDNVRYWKYEKNHYAPSASFYKTIFDKQGRAWIATWGEGLLITPQTTGQQPRKFEQFLNANGKEAQIHDLLLDHKGRLWICSNNGILMVNTVEKKITAQKFLRFSDENGKLPVSEINCGIEAHDGKLWFAATGGILKCSYNEKTGELKYELFDTSKGLTDNNTRSLEEDNYGNIWIGTEEGISRLNAKTNDIRSFQIGRTIFSNNFTENCATKLNDGRLVFGVSDGMIFIQPSRTISMPPAHMKAVITDLSINGISIYEAENEQFLTKALNYTREISLPHDKNSFNIHFSNFDYPHIQDAIYQYYMEGIDNTWRPMTSINHAEFSDLNPGSYTLHIRTRIGSNQWSEETLLHITICQPWYNTVWAWCIYLLIISGAGVLYYRSWLRNFELNQQIALEKQMSDFRINFFTHISHEFRTPLAIIQSAVEKMMTKGEGYASKNTIYTLSRGTKRLQRLINQLMEFRKINTSNMKLNVEKGEIIGFVRSIYNDFYTVAKQKDISMSFTPWTSNHEMLFDQEKVGTIVYNLLSNAVKYTPDKGIISVKLYLENNIVFFSVEDNGPGIKPEREADLFKPFMHGYASKGGMGIGLYTAHQMAEIHKGSLTYERSLNLGGSHFCLALPNDAGGYQPEDIIEKKALDDHSIDKDEIEMIVKEMTPKAINNVTVMVIEDDPDMLEQIKSELSVYFHVETFMNGKTGCENIRKIKPALLISDIQLPEMSGYEIVSNIKADPETQNIPVIMLTAFEDTSHILKAYKNFVDDYMVKPCNFKLLIARALQFVAMDLKAKQQAEEKAQLQEKALQENAPQENPEQTPGGKAILIKPVKELKKNEPTLLMSTLDKKFKDKLEAIVVQHISDNNFNVDRLAELLCLGRTTVYNRTKSIMGVSPNIYIQNERLRIAAKLLLEGEYTVSEISEKVGFSDSTYFYKCFKNKYGIAPSKYGK